MGSLVRQTDLKSDKMYPKRDQINFNTNLVLTDNFYDAIVVSI